LIPLKCAVSRPWTGRISLVPGLLHWVFEMAKNSAFSLDSETRFQYFSWLNLENLRKQELMRKDLGMFFWLPRLGVGAALLALLAFTSVSRAALYEITFNDRNINVGSGQIDVESASGNSYAVSGSLTVTAGQALGDWTLYVAGGTASYPSYLTSPAGAFLYNNAVYPTGQNPQYGDGGPLLDLYGLLFTDSNQDELNLWGNADGTYNLGGYVGGVLNFNVNISLGGTTIDPIPEPINNALIVFGLVFVGGACGRFILDRRRSAMKN
jgi:hypothetical protein